MAYKNIEDRRAYHKQYMKERRAWFKSLHFCTECGKQDAYTLNGRNRCYECSEKHNKQSNTERHKERNKEYAKTVYTKCIEQKICTQCHKRKPTPGRKICLICLAISRNRYLEKNAGNTLRHQRSSYGLCYICGKELDGQLKTDGRESKLCSHCYSRRNKMPRTRVLFTPHSSSEKALAAWEKCLAKREELLANGTYDYIPIVNVQPRGAY